MRSPEGPGLDRDWTGTPRTLGPTDPRTLGPTDPRTYFRDLGTECFPVEVRPDSYWYTTA